MNKKFLLILIFIVFKLHTANALCIVPENLIQIAKNSTFCYGTYNIPEGIQIINDNIALDCNNSVISGSFVSKGISIDSKNSIIIKNCIIKNYENGIYLKNSTNTLIKNNNLSKNNIGINLINAFENNVENNYDDSRLYPLNLINSKFNVFFYQNINLGGNEYCNENTCDSVNKKSPCVDNDNYCSLSCNQLNDNDCLLEINKSVEKINNETNFVIETQIWTPEKIYKKSIKIKNPEISEKEISEIFERIFNKYYNITKENLNIERSLYYNKTENLTKISLSIVPKKILYNLSVYENIPKCMAENVADILFYERNFEVIESEPLIVWKFPIVDGIKDISYKVKGAVSEECRDLLKVFGIATGFENFRKTDIVYQENYIKVIMPLLFLSMIIIGLIFILKPRKHQYQK